MTPSIQQVQDCIDFYLPTILTSEEPELFIENTNNRQLAGRIEGRKINLNLIIFRNVRQFLRAQRISGAAGATRNYF